MEVNENHVDVEAVKRRIEQVLSEILSDKYDCDIKIRFEKKNAASKKVE